MTTKTQKLHQTVRIIFLVILLVLITAVFSPFILPIILAAFIALGSERVFRKLHGKLNSRKRFVATVFAALFFLIVAPVTVFIAKAAEGLRSLNQESLSKSQFFQSLFTLWERGQSIASGMTQRFGVGFDVLPNKDDLFAKVSPVIIEKATLFVGALPDILLSLFVFLCMLFVFILYASDIKRGVVSLNLLPMNEINEIVQTFQSSSYIVLVSTLLIGAIQAFIVAFGSVIFGFHEFFLIFVLTFFLSFIPVIGAAPVAIVLSLIAFILGQNGHAIGLLVVAVISGSIDNVIKPYVYASSEDNLHPVVSLVGIIGSIIVFGIPGLLIGPFILQVFVKLAPKLSRNFLTPS